MLATIEISRLRSTSVPKPYAQHELIAERVFYTLPSELLDQVVARVGRGRFDAALLEMEFALSDINEDHSARVGFAAGRPINFHLLRDRPLEISPDDASFIGLESESARIDLVSLANSRLRYIRLPAQGYLGWLLTDPVFLDEHDELLRRCAKHIQHGCELPQAIRSIPAGTKMPDGWKRSQSKANNWIGEFREFCERWRLNQLKGPYLPEPLQPHLPSPFPIPGGSSLFVPDTFPVDGRGTFRAIIADAARAGDGNEHLAEWLDIVDSENSARNTIGRFARLFELQHYVRILQQRHPQALYRRKQRLQDVLADFLRVSLDSILKDWRFIDRRLGQAWPHRSVPFDS